MWKPLYPDFVVFHTDENGEVGASLIDPHGTFLADAHQKLKGLAEYAQQYGDRYRRVVSVYRDSSGTYRMLNLKDETIRAAIMETRGGKRRNSVQGTRSNILGNTHHHPPPAQHEQPPTARE